MLSVTTVSGFQFTFNSHRFFSFVSQENTCNNAGGRCADATKCVDEGGKTLSRKCPTQPNEVKCCIRTEKLEDDGPWEDLLMLEPKQI